MEAREIMKAAMAEIAELTKEAKAKADAYTAQPRTMEEMTAYRLEARKLMQQKVKEIAAPSTELGRLEHKNPGPLLKSWIGPNQAP